jgi:Fe-S oxidoreductase
MNYHLFVIPFCVGTVFLFGTLFFLFIKWIRNLSGNQKKTVRKNIFSLRTIKAVWEAVCECLFHRKIFKTNPLLGYMHLGFACGWFLLIVVGKIETTFYSRTFWDEPWLAIFFRYFENTSIAFTGRYFFHLTMDFLLLFVISALFLAFIKRFYSKIVGLRKTTKHTIYDKITITALWCIFPLRLLAESISAGIKNNGGFLTQSLGNALSFMPLQTIELYFWWAYSIALCVFFVGMPFTRYMHIFTEVLLIFLRKWGVMEEKNKSGYTSVELNACSRCGICIDICPLNTVLDIKNVQSVYFVRDARYNQLHNEITDNCLMCGRCVEACPVGIESTKIREIYRKKEHFEDKNYYDFINENSTETAMDVIYFAGCMSHLIPGITASMKKIFQSVNQSFWFMDEDKSICCGRPLLQQGFQKQASILRDKNTALIEKSGAKRLITSCPICYQSFTKEYNLKIEVLHHTQYIDRLITDKLIQVKKTDLNIVYHDPCELGRGCGIYEEPRKIIRTIGNLLHSENEGKNSLCCGYNLGNTVIELHQQMQIRDDSLKNLTNTHPNIIATACPMCKRAFSHGKKENVKDIAEMVAGCL